MLYWMQIIQNCEIRRNILLSIYGWILKILKFVQKNIRVCIEQDLFHFYVSYAYFALFSYHIECDRKVSKIWYKCSSMHSQVSDLNTAGLNFFFF